MASRPFLGTVGHRLDLGSLVPAAALLSECPRHLGHQVTEIARPWSPCTAPIGSRDGAVTWKSEVFHPDHVTWPADTTTRALERNQIAHLRDFITSGPGTRVLGTQNSTCSTQHRVHVYMLTPAYKSWGQICSDGIRLSGS